MAIGKLPKASSSSSQLEHTKEQAANAFIHKGELGKKEMKGRKTPIMIRFDNELLEKVESLAKRRGINRSALIQFLVSKSIDEGDI